MLRRQDGNHPGFTTIRLMNAKKACFIASFFWLACCSATAEQSEVAAPNAQLSLPVVGVAESYPSYADFCRRHPQECDLSGASVVAFSDDLMHQLSQVNLAVNMEIRFAFDADQYGAEEYWALPSSGYGDCEDLALEKRSRLAASGVPRGALRLAIVFHKRHLNSHCILTVETSQGTYILDSYTNRICRWDKTPYNFEVRERADGQWDRFDQTDWRYDN